jgi:hypothetical protein
MPLRFRAPMRIYSRCFHGSEYGLFWLLLFSRLLKSTTPAIDANDKESCSTALFTTFATVLIMTDDHLQYRSLMGNNIVRC